MRITSDKGYAVLFGIQLVSIPTSFADLGLHNRNLTEFLILLISWVDRYLTSQNTSISLVSANKPIHAIGVLVDQVKRTADAALGRKSVLAGYASSKVEVDPITVFDPPGAMTTVVDKVVERADLTWISGVQTGAWDADGAPPYLTEGTGAVSKYVRILAVSYFSGDALLANPDMAVRTRLKIRIFPLTTDKSPLIVCRAFMTS